MFLGSNIHLTNSEFPSFIELDKPLLRLKENLAASDKVTQGIGTVTETESLSSQCSMRIAVFRLGTLWRLGEHNKNQEILGILGTVRLSATCYPRNREAIRAMICEQCTTSSPVVIKSWQFASGNTQKYDIAIHINTHQLLFKSCSFEFPMVRGAKFCCEEWIWSGAPLPQFQWVLSDLSVSRTRGSHKYAK